VSDCLFCRIAAGEIPAKIVARTPRALAFHDIGPQAPTHVLVIPIEHLGGPADLASEAGEAAAGHLLRFAAEVARQLGLAESGYRLVLNQGADGGQSVGHVHIHVLGGRRMKWPPG
jgi:histidine triad (HIT) family protein